MCVSDTVDVVVAAAARISLAFVRMYGTYTQTSKSNNKFQIKFNVALKLNPAAQTQ